MRRLAQHAYDEGSLEREAFQAQLDALIQHATCESEHAQGKADLPMRCSRLFDSVPTASRTAGTSASGVDDAALWRLLL